MATEEDFFPEFYYPDEIATENESNVDVLFISCARPERSQSLSGRSQFLSMRT